MTPEEIAEQKEIAYFASAVNAWFSTALEFDKSILTLAVGGIGLLITLLTTGGLSSSLLLILYFGAIASFLITIIAVLVILHQNKKHIEDILAKKNTADDPVLVKVDSIVLCAFGSGVAFTALIGFTTAFYSYTSKDKSVANNSTKPTQPIHANDSYNGATNLQKSFTGAAMLQPQPAASTTAPAAGAASPTSSATSANKTGNNK